MSVDPYAVRIRYRCPSWSFRELPPRLGRFRKRPAASIRCPASTGFAICRAPVVTCRGTRRLSVALGTFFSMLLEDEEFPSCRYSARRKGDSLSIDLSFAPDRLVGAERWYAVSDTLDFGGSDWHAEPLALSGTGRTTVTVPFPSLGYAACYVDLIYRTARRSALPVLDPDFPFRRETGFLIRWPGTTGFLSFSASFFRRDRCLRFVGLWQVEGTCLCGRRVGECPRIVKPVSIRNNVRNRGARVWPFPRRRNRFRSAVPPVWAGKRARAGTGLLGRRRECREMPPVGGGSSRRSPNSPAERAGMERTVYVSRHVPVRMPDDCRRRVSLRP